MNKAEKLLTLADEEFQGAAYGLGDIKGVEPGAKDTARMRDIITKSKGDESKMMNLVKRMAKTITKIDKAQRRAAAAMMVMPAAIAQKAAQEFLAKF